MSVWQLVSAGLAIAFPAVYGLRYLRPPGWPAAILALQLLGVTEVALIAGALGFLPPPDLEISVPAVAVVYVIAGGVLVLSWRRRRELKSAVVVDVDSVQRDQLAALVARFAIVVAVSGLLLVFSWWWALANVLASALWAALWIPDRWRRVSLEVSTDIAASAAAVTPFITDTDLWPRYRQGFVRAEPPGRLGVGTQILSRMVREAPRDSVRMPRPLEVRVVVTSIGPGAAYAGEIAGHPDERGGVDLMQLESGRTRVRSWAAGRLSFADGVSGHFFLLPRVTAASRASMERTLADLKAAVEAPVSR